MTKRKMIEEKYIRSFEDFNCIIKDNLKKGYSFFRGDKAYDSNRTDLLYTSFDRKEKNKFIYKERMDNEMINDFISISLSKMAYRPTNYMEEMLMAQHYGIPTRLQDWSESPLVALFFATSNSKQMSESDQSILWCLNPITLNTMTKQILSDVTNDTYIPNISLDSTSESALGYIEKNYGHNAPKNDLLYPIAIQTYKINPRIEAQKGVFLLYPRNRKSLISYENVENFLMKLVIEKEAAMEMEEILRIYGINNFQLFPEIGSIALDVIRKYEVK